MDNELGKEIITFEAHGLDEMKASVAALEKAIKSTYARAQALNDSLNTPSQTKERAEIQKLTADNARLKTIEEGRNANAIRSGRLASGEYHRQAGELAAIRHEAEKLGLAERRASLGNGDYLRNREQTGRLANATARQGLSERQAALASGLLVKEAMLEGRLRGDIDRLRLAERQALLESGQFAADARQRNDLGRSSLVLAHAERRVELQATHGRLGGAALYGLERARPGLLAAGVAGSVGIGMAKSGFSGTVEGNALAMEMHLLNREIAGALLPVLKDVTRVFRGAREMLQGLSGGQQDALGYGMAGLAGLGTIGLAVGPLSKMAAGLRKIGGMLGIGGAAGAAAGSAVVDIGGTAAATYAGGRLAGTGGAAAATRMSRLARFGRVAGPVAAGAALVATVGGTPEGSKSYYKLMREAGGSIVTSGIGSFFASLAEGSGGLDLMESFGFKGSKQSRADLAAKKVRDMNDPHHNAMIADAGFGSVEDPYERISNAVSVQAAIEAEPGGKLDERGKKAAEPASEETQKQILESLKKQNQPPLR